MARGELMKKLLASYGRDEEFRAVAEQIIGEEEKKNNRVLARSLRKSLEAGPSPRSKPRGLAPLIPFPESAGDFIELVERAHTTMVQPIYEVDCERMVYENTVLIGDAAHVVRPHVGTGVLKAGQDARALAGAVEASVERPMLDCARHKS